MARYAAAFFVPFMIALAMITQDTGLPSSTVPASDGLLLTARGMIPDIGEVPATAACACAEAYDLNLENGGGYACDCTGVSNQSNTVCLLCKGTPVAPAIGVVLEPLFTYEDGLTYGCDEYVLWQGVCVNGGCTDQVDSVYACGMTYSSPIEETQ